METATPGRRATPDGWLNRLLSMWRRTPRPARAVRGVNLGPTMRGSSWLAHMSRRCRPRPRPAPASRAVSPTLAAALDRAYADDAAMAAPGRRCATRVPRWRRPTKTWTRASRPDRCRSPGSPATPRASDGCCVGRRRCARPPSRWAAGDTHVNQGGAQASSPADWGRSRQGLDALVRALDDRLGRHARQCDVEFGRTVRQNGTRGTDHGHGNAMWLIGGSVRATRARPLAGLDAAALHDGATSPVTTDFRQVIAQALARHMRLDDRGDRAGAARRRRSAAPLELIRG
jgi:uncharacterized protein (DUF1501 family)